MKESIIEKLGITPGPWKKYDRSVDVYAPSKLICQCNIGSGDPEAVTETMSTANLIAAAPEMLEALIEEVLFIEKIQSLHFIVKMIRMKK